MIGGIIFGPVTDYLGRKKAIFICAVGVVFTSILQTASQNVAMFTISRLLVGFFCGSTYICGPAYLAETLPPQWRGVGLGVFMDFYYIGGLMSAGITYGSFKMNSTWSWRLPSALQGGFTLLALGVLPFIPESPRWLVSKGQQFKALEALSALLADGNVEDPLVLATYKEIVDTLAYEEEKARNGYTYSKAVKSKTVLRRLALVTSVAIISMASGNNIISFYLGAMLNNAGVVDPNTQLQINIYLNVWCLACALVGTAVVDRIGRKLLATISSALMAGLIFAVGALTKAYGESLDTKGVYGTVASIFLFQGAYSFAWTPLAMLYPPEVLNYSMRSVGLGFYAFWTNGFGLMVTMSFPYALEAIGWKTYMINGAWDVVQLIYVMIFWVETKGRTLEGIDEIFDGIRHSDGPSVNEVAAGQVATLVLEGVDVKVADPVVASVKAGGK